MQRKSSLMDADLSGKHDADESLMGRVGKVASGIGKRIKDAFTPAPIERRRKKVVERAQDFMDEPSAKKRPDY